MGAFDYKTLEKVDFSSKNNEFGHEAAPGLLVYKGNDGTFVVATGGRRLAPVYPDNSVEFQTDVLLVTGMRPRLSLVLFGLPTTLRASVDKKASGIYTYRMEGVTYDYSRRKEVHVADKLVTSAVAVRAFRVVDDIDKVRTFVPTIDAPIIQKDDKAYNAFSAELKKLRAAIHTQIRLGTYEEIRKNSPRTSYGSYNKYVAQRVGELFQNAKYVPPRTLNDKLVSLVRTWVETKDAALLQQIVLLCLYNRTTVLHKDTNEHMSRCVTNALRGIQTQYLRDNCVTIVESETIQVPNDEHDKDGQLQSTTGL